MDIQDHIRDMQRYRDYAPTGFDTVGAFLPDQGNWIVVPVGQNRDSNYLEESNFQTALDMLGEESDTVQVHRFGHWACGWYEIIIVDPGDNDRAIIAAEIMCALADYPILDDMDYSEREWNRASEYWEQNSMSDRINICKRFDISIFAARRDDIPEDSTGEIVSYLAE